MVKKYNQHMVGVFYADRGSKAQLIQALAVGLEIERLQAAGSMLYWDCFVLLGDA